jgi:hypothetical protein
VVSALIEDQSEVCSSHLIGSLGVSVFSVVFLLFVGLSFCRMWLLIGVPGLM